MKRYESYKEVDLPWLKEVPRHWEISKNGNIFRYKKEINKNGQENNVLSLTLRGVVNNDIENPIGLVPKDYSTYQIFEKHDLVFKLIDLNNVKTSRVGVAHEKGIMSSAYIRFCINNKIGYYKYFYYWFFKLYIEEVFNKLGNGVRETIGKDELRNMLSPLPPLSEQEQIANFLDLKISEIDRLIELEKRKIEKLDELKKNFFSYLMANEKGYETICIKSILKMRNLRQSSTSKQFNLLSVVRDKGIMLRDLSEESDNHNVIPEDLSNYKVVFEGDFVINKMKAWQGSYGVSKLEGIVSPAYFVFEVITDEITLDFFHMAIRCIEYIDQFAKYSKGIRVGQWDFDISELKNIVFKYPILERQEFIVNKVKSQHIMINKKIKAVNQQITYLEEFKQTLISDAVTGKIDVRGIKIPKK